MPATLAKQVVTGLARPVFVTAPPGDSDRLFILEQHTGRVRVFRQGAGKLLETPFLELAGLSLGNEEGLLGLAFAPDYATSGHFYVSLTIASNASQLRRYRVSSANPDAADPASAETLLTVEQPFANHKAGWTAFGPDGMLYVGLGDGGSEGDPNNTSQNLGLLLGKMLRLDVRAPGPAAIPPDNPFRARPGARPEIWAYGLRNPWRCGFDRKTGDLYMGDVGQDRVEEVDFQPAASRGGENYGWSIKEGNEDFKPDQHAGQTLTPPIFTYTHDQGEAIIGGYVYRGSAVSGLQGTYFFADFSGRVFSFRFDGTTVTESADRTDELFPDGGPDSISSFGEDAAGELYIVSLTPGKVFKITAGA